MPRLAVVHRLAQLGAQRDAQVRVDDRFDGRRREPVGEGAVLEPGDERGTSGGLDHGAGHQVGELLDRGLGTRGMNTVAHQQNRALSLPNQLRGLGDFGCARALVDEPVPVRRQRVRNVELFEQHVCRVFDVGRARRAGHRPTDCLADDLVGLIGVLNGCAVLHRRREKWLLADELDATATHPAFGDACPLATEEDHWRVLDLGAHHRPGDVGHTRPESADAKSRSAGHARNGLGHEACAQLVVRRHHRPSACIRLGEHVHEVGIRYAEQRVDTLGLEQVENAFVDGYTHVKLLDFLYR